VKRAYLNAALVILWLCMLAWLVRYEAFPEFFTHTLAGYSHLLSRDVLVMDSWMKILSKGNAVGYSHTSLDVDEANPVDHYTIDNRVHLRLKIAGEDQTINVDTSASLNAMYELQKFSFSLASRGYSVIVDAARRNERTFRVKMTTGNTSERMEVDIPPDVVLYSPMMELAMKQLKPGQHFSMKTLNPTSFSAMLITISAIRQEPLTIGGKTYDATVLSTDYGGTLFLSWMDPAGNILRQDTPMGWTMEKCTADDAAEIIRGSAPTQDILAEMAVPCTGAIRDPRHCRKLKLSLKGVSFSRAELEITSRQKVAGTDGTNTILDISAGMAPADPSPQTPIPPALRPLLGATTSLQADHPDMIKQARAIVGQRQIPSEKALAIYDWVNRNVAKEMTISLPSALDVLRTMKGDCNEHTYLSVALARAAGLPAKVVVGLAYHEGKFYYHAWPAIYAGRWIEMDPTWGQPAVDATHLALVEGEMDQQVQLIKVLGQLKIQVIEESDHD